MTSEETEKRDAAFRLWVNANFDPANTRPGTPFHKAFCAGWLAKEQSLDESDRWDLR